MARRIWRRDLVGRAPWIGPGFGWRGPALAGIDRAVAAMEAFAFPAAEQTPELARLRAEVRGFLSERLADRPAIERAESWNGVDFGFSRELGKQGWIGMTWPRRYGGGERSALER